LGHASLSGFQRARHRDSECGRVDTHRGRDRATPGADPRASFARTIGGNKLAKFDLELTARECGILIYALGTVYERVPESFTLAERIAALSLWSDASAARSPQPVGMPAAVDRAAPAPEPLSTPAPPPKKQLVSDGELTITLIAADM